MDAFLANVEQEKAALPPAIPQAPKQTGRRVIKTALENKYVKGLVLNSDVEVRMQRNTRCTRDFRDTERPSLQGCPLKKEPTLRSDYRLEAKVQ